jgi:hypothetical protein
VLAAHGFTPGEIAALKDDGVVVTERRRGPAPKPQPKAAE